MTHDYVTAVCGFGRCGTTMVMTMLDAGGLPPLDDATSGAYEVHVDELLTRPADRLAGRAVKLLDHVHWNHPNTLPDLPWRFIWCERNSRQQALSMVKFIGALAPDVARGMPPNQVGAFRRSFERDQAGTIRALQDVGPVLRVKFEHVLDDPVGQSARIADFLDLDDVLAMSNVVRRRPPECAPDLAIELEIGQLRREEAAS